MPPANNLLLSGARVFRHAGDTDNPPIADVLISQGTIQSVEPPNTMRSLSNPVEHVDLRGHVLIPGFVNAHYHSHDALARGLFECMPLEQWILIASPLGNFRSLEEVRVRTLLGAIEALRNGITTVQDFCSFLPLDDVLVDTILDAYEEAGIRVVYSINLRDITQLESVFGARDIVPRQLWPIFSGTAGDAKSQIAFAQRQVNRVGERGGMIVWALSPGSPQRCSPELLQRVAALASECDLPIFTHVYESRAQRLFSEDNYKDYAGSIFRYMSANGVLGPRVTIAHGVWPALEEIEYLADTGTGIVLNMLSNLRLRNGVPPISAYRRLGIPLSLGSDNCTCSDVQSIFQVMKLYCLLGGIMEPDVEPPSAAEALRLATIGGANRAGIDNRIGAIEPGMKADLVALDLADPAFRPLHSIARQLVYSELGRSVRHVWVDGKQVVCNGASLLVNEGRLLEELSIVMPELRRTIDRLSTEAKCFGSVSAQLHNAAWSRPLPYNRFLSAS